MEGAINGNRPWLYTSRLKDTARPPALIRNQIPNRPIVRGIQA
jgi:hypothetical protein